MMRFWITLDQGVEFVLQSLDRMWGGEIFVPKIPSMNIVDLAAAIAPECETEIVGIRSGEKLHEVMVPVDDARNTLEFDDHYTILPPQESTQKQQILAGGGRPCPDGFYFASDNNPKWLTEEELQSMIAPFVQEGERVGG